MKLRASELVHVLVFGENRSGLASIVVVVLVNGRVFLGVIFQISFPEILCCSISPSQASSLSPTIPPLMQSHPSSSSTCTTGSQLNWSVPRTGSSATVHLLPLQRGTAIATKECAWRLSTQPNASVVHPPNPTSRTDLNLTDLACMG